MIGVETVELKSAPRSQSTKTAPSHTRGGEHSVLQKDGGQELEHCWCRIVIAAGLDEASVNLSMLHGLRGVSKVPDSRKITARFQLW
jgi:hypothetical protein